MEGVFGRRFRDGAAADRGLGDYGVDGAGSAHRKDAEQLQIGLGGEARIKVDVDLGAMVPRDTFRGWRFRTQYWAQGVKIRTNMTSSVWFDLEDAIAAKDGTVVDDNRAEIPGREVLRILDELQEDPKTAAFRWVVAVGEDNMMKLQLQSLPGPAVLIAGKPTLRQ